MNTVTLWTWSLVVGAVVIMIVALLLVAILATARHIDRHAADIWQVGKSIAGNTVSIWMLEHTNQLAKEILGTAQSIDNSVKSLAGKLG
jgi:hypothetical protein